MRKSTFFSRSVFSASKMMRIPLYHISRPTKRKTGTFCGRSYLPVAAAMASSDTRPRGTSTPFSITM